MWSKIITIISVILLSGIILSTIVSANTSMSTIHIKNEDTALKVSHLHMKTVEKIKEMNYFRPELIHPGQFVTVSPEQRYTVKNGDTLWTIARAFHLHVTDLLNRNSLKTELIQPGFTLVIPNGSTTSKESFLGSDRKLVQLGDSQAKVAAAPKLMQNITKVRAAITTVRHSGRVIFVTATAYTASCASCSGITASGINILSNPNAKVISVDPSVIPLGSKVYIDGLGVYTAGDTGGAIKGNRIDILMPSERAALYFGRKHLKVTVFN